MQTAPLSPGKGRVVAVEEPEDYGSRGWDVRPAKQGKKNKKGQFQEAEQSCKVGFQHAEEKCNACSLQ